MKNRRKYDLAYLWLVFPLLRFTWPILQYKTPSNWVAPFVIIWFLIIFCRNRRTRVAIRGLSTCLWIMVFAFLLYIFLPLLYGYTSPENRISFRMINAIARVVELAVYLSIVHYSLLMGKVKEMKMMVGVVLFSILWAAIAAFQFGNSVVELGGARAISALSSGNAIGQEHIDVAMTAADVGMGTAGSTYISSFLIPVFFYSFFEVRGRWKKAACCIMIYANFLNIKYGGLNTPYMIAVVGLLLAIVAKWSKSRITVICCGVIAAIFMLAFAFNQKILFFMGPPLRALSEITSDQPQLSARLLSTAEAVEGSLDTYAATRYELQQRSARGFLEGSIVFGAVGSDQLKAGGHSELLDCLACFGLLGGGVIVLFWMGYLSYNDKLSQVLGKRWSLMPYVYVSTWIFASIPNPVALGSPDLIFLIPGIALFYSEFEKRNY